MKGHLIGIACGLIATTVFSAAPDAADVRRAREQLALFKPEAARRAIALVPEKRPFRVILPAEIAVEFSRTDYADAAMDRHPDAERLDPRTVRRVIREIREYGDLLI